MKAAKDIFILAYLLIMIVSFLGTVVGFFYKPTTLWLISFVVFVATVALASSIVPEKGNGFNPMYD